MPPSFVPVSLEAEATGSLFSGGAAPVTCGPCYGGWRVGYIFGPGQVTVFGNLPSGGLRTVRVTYETDGPRQLKIKANNQVVDVRWLTGTGWEVPMTFEFTSTLTAGPLQLVFYNDESPAPDVDRVVLS
jgi:hypothetical protein